MQRRFVILAGATLLATGLGLVATSARSAEPSGSADQRPAAAAPQQSAATSMVVYKSQT